MVHLPINVLKEEGIELAEQYNVGTVYPVFILTNSRGDVITRWTGYTGGAHTFVNTLQRALTDLTTVDERIARFQANPTRQQAVILARFHSDIGEHLAAVKYYRQAQILGGSASTDYAYDIFSNTANAVWKEQTEFSDIYPVADAVLLSKRRNDNNIINVAKLMSRLARKFETTDSLDKYLSTALRISENSRSQKQKESHNFLLTEQSLQVRHDTSRAIAIKKTSMGSAWENDRDKFYSFAKWCLERNMNLEEAETLARRAIDLVHPGTYRARVLNTVAEICYLRGKKAEAVRMTEWAIDQHPENPFYTRQLKRFQETVNEDDR